MDNSPPLRAAQPAARRNEPSTQDRGPNTRHSPSPRTSSSTAGGVRDIAANRTHHTTSRPTTRASEFCAARVTRDHVRSATADEDEGHKMRARHSGWFAVEQRADKPRAKNLTARTQRVAPPSSRTNRGARQPAVPNPRHSPSRRHSQHHPGSATPTRSCHNQRGVIFSEPADTPTTPDPDFVRVERGARFHAYAEVDGYRMGTSCHAD